MYCFGAIRPRPLFRTRCLQIKNRFLLKYEPILQQYNCSVDDCALVNNNDPIHRQSSFLNIISINIVSLLFYTIHLCIHVALPISKRYTTLCLKRGYRCVYLPPYSPELNLIEQLRSQVKYLIKREQDTPPLRTYNTVTHKVLQGYARYSIPRFVGCLKKAPI